ncbi:MAG: hypothetical protein KJN76_03245, partial [Eudoraea sp.]|nr:hypothetical protein [Eudoraea sp.]
NVVLENALLEIWHLSPNSTKYSHRAKLRINALGEYRFITDLPGRAIGENYKIYFKITVGDQSYFTKLSFNNIQAYIWGLKSQNKTSSAKESSSTVRKTSVCKTTIAFNLKLR